MRGTVAVFVFFLTGCWAQSTSELEVLGNGELTAQRFTLNVNTFNGQTTWATKVEDFLDLRYPGNTPFGLIYFTPATGMRSDLSGFESLLLEIRAPQNVPTGVVVLAGIRSSNQAPGFEQKIPIKLSAAWQTIRLPLSRFPRADLKAVEIAAEIVFEGRSPVDVQLRRVALSPFRAIATFAGADWKFPAISRAKDAPFGDLYGIGIGAGDQVCISDFDNNMISTLSWSGEFAVAAGTGERDLPSPGVAVKQRISWPKACRFNPLTNELYFLSNDVIWRIDRNGNMLRFAGGAAGANGDPVGKRPTEVSLPGIRNFAFSPDGTLFFTDDRRLLAVESDTIRLVAGSLTGYYPGGAATGAAVFAFGEGGDIAAVSQDEVYLVEGQTSNDRTGAVRRVLRTSNRVEYVLQNGRLACGGVDSHPIHNPLAIAWNPRQSTLYVTSSGTAFGGVFAIETPSCGVRRVAGQARNEPSGEFDALSARIAVPRGLAFSEASEDLYVQDGNRRILRISAGRAQVVAGNGKYRLYGDGGRASSATLYNPLRLAVDGVNKTIYLADGPMIRQIEAETIKTVWGTTTGPDGPGPEFATQRTISTAGITIDPGRRLLYLDPSYGGLYEIGALDNQIRLLLPSGQGGSGVDLKLRKNGNIVISDSDRNRILEWTPGTPAPLVIASGFNQPRGIAIDPTDESVVVADKGNHCIKRVSVSRAVTQIAGTCGVAEELQAPEAVDVNSFGQIVIADTGHGLVKVLSPTGLRTIAGGLPQGGGRGDGGDPTAARLTPIDVKYDWDDNVLIVDQDDARVRKVLFDPAELDVVADPSQLSLFGTVGANAQVKKGLNLTGSLAGATFNLSIPDSGLRNRIQLSNQSGSIPASVEVTVNTVGLAAGPYTSELLATTVNGRTPTRIPIQLTMANAPQPSGKVTWSPPTITAPALKNQTEHIVRQVSLSGDIGASFVVGQPTVAWLSVETKRGVFPSSFDLTIKPELAPDLLNQTRLSILNEQGVEVASIPVELAILTTEGAAFELDKAALLMTMPRSRDQQADGFSIVNTGTTTLSVSARVKTASPWLTLQDAGSVLFVSPRQPATFNIVARRDGSQNQQAATITISVSGFADINLPVSVIASNGRPIVSAAGVTLFGKPGLPRDQKTILLWNPDPDQPIDPKVELEDPNFLLKLNHSGDIPPNGIKPVSIATAEGVDTLGGDGSAKILFRTGQTVPDEVKVTIRRVSALPPRVNTAGILLGAPGHASARIEIQATEERERDAAILFPCFMALNGATSPIRLPGLNGGAPPPPVSLNFSIRNPIPPNCDFKSSSIEVNYLGFQFENGDSHKESISVVVPDEAKAGERGAAGDCVSNKIYPVILKPSNSFRVEAGEYVPVEVQLFDNCGNAVSDVGARGTASNGDQAVELIVWPDKVWRGTWVPKRSADPQVYFGITVADSQRRPVAPIRVFGSLESNAPVIDFAGIRNGAGFQLLGNSVAPGQIITIPGSRLASEPRQAGATPLETLGGVRVRLGSTPLLLFYVSPQQINALVPFEVGVGQQLPLTVESAGLVSESILVRTVASKPGIFMLSETRGAITNASNGVIGSVGEPFGAVPARRGEVIVVYGTGFGLLSATVPTAGGAPSTGILPQLRGSMVVSIGGVPSQRILFKGLTPGSYGLNQINVEVPTSAPTGERVPITMSLDGTVTNAAFLALVP